MSHRLTATSAALQVSQIRKRRILPWSKGLKPAQMKPVTPGKAGHVGWHELHATDWERALAFYVELFGWQKTNFEINTANPYQPFALDGPTIGGMFTKPLTEPVPFWLYYFQCRRYRGGRAAHSAPAAGYLQVRFNFPAAAGSSDAVTRRAPHLRCKGHGARTASAGPPNGAAFRRRANWCPASRGPSARLLLPGLKRMIRKSRTGFPSRQTPAARARRSCSTRRTTSMIQPSWTMP